MAERSKAPDSSASCLLRHLVLHEGVGSNPTADTVFCLPARLPACPPARLLAWPSTHRANRIIAASVTVTALLRWFASLENSPQGRGRSRGRSRGRRDLCERRNWGGGGGEQSIYLLDIGRNQRNQANRAGEKQKRPTTARARRSHTNAKSRRVARSFARECGGICENAGRR